MNFGKNFSLFALTGFDRRRIMTLMVIIVIVIAIIVASALVYLHRHSKMLKDLETEERLKDLYS